VNQLCDVAMAAWCAYLRSARVAFARMSMAASIAISPDSGASAPCRRPKLMIVWTRVSCQAFAVQPGLRAMYNLSL